MSHASKRGSGNLQWSICLRALSDFVSLLSCLDRVGTQPCFSFLFFNYILLLPRSSAVMSNVCLCLNYNHLPALSFCFSPVLPLSSLFTSLACSKTIFLRVRDKIVDASSKTGNVAGWSSLWRSTSAFLSAAIFFFFLLVWTAGLW